jgi:hypothetical protein
MHPAAHRIHLRQLPEVRITRLGFAGRVRGQIGTRAVYGVASGEESVKNISEITRLISRTVRSPR